MYHYHGHDHYHYQHHYTRSDVPYSTQGSTPSRTNLPSDFSTRRECYSATYATRGIYGRKASATSLQSHPFRSGCPFSFSFGVGENPKGCAMVRVVCHVLRYVPLIRRPSHRVSMQRFLRIKSVMGYHCSNGLPSASRQDPNVTEGSIPIPAVQVACLRCYPNACRTTVGRFR